MGARDVPPFRADHVGSLLRPPELLRARAGFANGTVSAAELRAVEDAAIRSVVRIQEEIGLRSATDGEFRRASWHLDFLFQLAGIRPTEERVKVRFHNPKGTVEFEAAGIRVDGKVRLERTIFADHFTYLRDVATTAVPKLTIPSPNVVHFRSGPGVIDRTVYPDLEEFWADLATAYAEQVRGIGALGCRYLQLDDTTLAYLNDPAQRAIVSDRGEDAEQLLPRYIGQLNAAVAGRPKGMNVTVHLCRGNFRSSWYAQGGYDFVAERLFGELEVDGIFLEYDDARSGGFEPLRFVPRGKAVALGLVTTKRGQLESKDDLKRRIDEASRYVPIEQLCLAPQCGFSSTVEGNLLSQDEQFAKLRLIVETAAEIWG